MSKKKTKLATMSNKRCTCGHLARSHMNKRGFCLYDAECDCREFRPPSVVRLRTVKEEVYGETPGLSRAPFFVFTDGIGQKPLLRCEVTKPMFYRSSHYTIPEAFERRNVAATAVRDKIRQFLMEGGRISFYELADDCVKATIKALGVSAHSEEEARALDHG